MRRRMMSFTAAMIAVLAIAAIPGCQSSVQRAPEAAPDTQPAPNDPAGAMAADDTARAKQQLDEQNKAAAGSGRQAGPPPTDYRRGNRVVDQPRSAAPRR